MRKIIVVLMMFYFTLLWSQWKEHPPVPVNLFNSPGAVNVHYNSGGRRMARIDSVLFILAPEIDGEKLYKTTDNGASFEEVYSEPTFSSCLITGKNKKIYHFFIRNSTLRVKKISLTPFGIEDIAIYSSSDLRNTTTGAYRAVNAIVDSAGILYVAAHWEANGAPDQIFVFRSKDEGMSWEGPFQVSEGPGPWYYPHMEVNTLNILVIVYSHFLENQLNFARSFDQGMTWETKVITTQKYPNPAILTVGDSTLFIFTQGGVNQLGLQFNVSYDLGDSWQGFRLVDSTCGYADPSPGLGADGTIYVAFRSSNGSGLVDGSCGDRCKSRLAMSTDMGKTWAFPDDYYQASERVGTRNQIRYQTWFNYGGPLEWIWMQYVNNGAQHPIFYDVNFQKEIYNATEVQLINKIHKKINQYKKNPSSTLKDSINHLINNWDK